MLLPRLVAATPELQVGAGTAQARMVVRSVQASSHKRERSVVTAWYIAQSTSRTYDGPHLASSVPARLPLQVHMEAVKDRDNGVASTSEQLHRQKGPKHAQTTIHLQQAPAPTPPGGSADCRLLVITDFRNMVSRPQSSALWSPAAAAPAGAAWRRLPLAHRRGSRSTLQQVQADPAALQVRPAVFKVGIQPVHEEQFHGMWRH